MVKNNNNMRTLIEVKTGKTVDTGDFITVNDKQVKLTDLEVPSLIAKGILSFAHSNSSVDINKNVADFSKKELNTPMEPVVKLFDIKNPLLKSILYNWSADCGMDTAEDHHQLISLLWHVYPMSVLEIALKEMSKELEPDADKFPPVVFVFDKTCGKFTKVKAANKDRYNYIAYFTSKHWALYAYSVCKELIDALFNGKQED